MATIPINDTSPRVAYIATSAQTVFPYPFWISAEEDIVVYPNGTTLALATDYTISKVLEPTGGDITLVTGALLNDEIVIIRDIPVKRVSEFQTGGSFQASVLNSALSKHVAMIQQVETNQSRSLQLNASDNFGGDMILPNITSGRYLKVNSDATGWEMGAAPVVTDTSLSISVGDEYKIVSVNSSADDFDILADAGTSGQVLTSTGASSAPTWQNAGVNGKVLQVVSTTVSTNTASASSSYIDATDVNVSITPSVTSSKVLVRITGCGLLDSVIGTSAGIRILRDSTPIVEQSNLIKSHTASNDGFGFCIEFYDTPNTTSAITYKLQFKRNQGAGVIWINGGATYDTTITATEIGA